MWNATIAGSTLGVKAALQKGASVEYYHRPEDHKTCLHMAAESGHLEICQQLLEAGSNVNQIAITNKDTPLVLAASYGHAHIVKVFLEHDPIAEINSQNAYGNSALHEAARHGFLECVEILLGKGADTSLLNNKGSTALHLACYGEDKNEFAIELVQILASKIDVNAVDNRGVSALIAACSVGREDVITFLLDNGADGKKLDNSGMDGLATAVFQKKRLQPKIQKRVSSDEREHPESVFRV